MKHIGNLVFDMLGWWRVGSGRGDGSLLDDVCSRSPQGLPWIPGATVKGLAREAVQELCDLGQGDQASLESFFGKAAEGTSDTLPGRFLSEAGGAKFDPAELPLSWRDWASVDLTDRAAEQRTEIIAALFHRRAMTAVDELGGAKAQSLRTVEVVAPMTLSAAIWVADDIPAYQLAKASPLIRRIGMGRNRGFGRVATRFEPAGGTA